MNALSSPTMEPCAARGPLANRRPPITTPSGVPGGRRHPTVREDLPRRVPVRPVLAPSCSNGTTSARHSPDSISRPSRVLGERDVERKVLGDAGIVRHRGKINAAINNAARALELIDEAGSRHLRLAVRTGERRQDCGRTCFDLTGVCGIVQGAQEAWLEVRRPTTMYAFMQSMGWSTITRRVVSPMSPSFSPVSSSRVRSCCDSAGAGVTVERTMTSRSTEWLIEFTVAQADPGTVATFVRRTADGIRKRTGPLPDDAGDDRSRYRRALAGVPERSDHDRPGRHRIGTRRTPSRGAAGHSPSRSVDAAEDLSGGADRVVGLRGGRGEGRTADLDRTRLLIWFWTKASRWFTASIELSVAVYQGVQPDPATRRHPATRTGGRRPGGNEISAAELSAELGGYRVSGCGMSR